ncbi:MAG: F0F1 ATP synthase subunit A [Chloroflexi bacterium]|nr:F0F1 ATP synthase subunit A [Chloroflexota bacterium]
MENLLEEFASKPVSFLHLGQLRLFGLDVGVNEAVLTMWLAVFLVSVIVIYAGRGRGLVAGGFKGAVEAVLEFIRKDIVLENIGHEGMYWYPFITALFLFIWFSNLVSLTPGIQGATSNINTTATLAVIVFLAVVVQGIVKKGPIKYWLSLVPKGVPAWLAPVLFVIELISLLAKPFSLALRLFANMFAGHVVLAVFLSLIFFFGSYAVAPAPLLLNIMMRLLEVLFGSIQAYIFAMFATMYIAASIHDEH